MTKVYLTLNTGYNEKQKILHCRNNMYTINLRKKVIYPQCGGITLDSDIVEFSVDTFNLVGY
jgi:hypothetical protein